MFKTMQEQEDIRLHVHIEDTQPMELLDLTRRCFSAFDLEPPSALETAQVDSTPVTRGELAQLADQVIAALSIRWLRPFSRSWKARTQSSDLSGIAKLR